MINNQPLEAASSLKIQFNIKLIETFHYLEPVQVEMMKRHAASNFDLFFNDSNARPPKLNE